MKIQVLGGHGGLSQGFSTTSFLIDNHLALDAGSLASALTIKEQCQIENILISHCHLDHIKDLAFISDNCFGQKSKTFEVYTHQTVKEVIKKHLLNDIIWPDFTKLPSEANPTMRINAVEDGQSFSIGNYLITPVKVNHALDAMGFIIEKNNSAVLFTLDTGPTERIWEFAHKTKNLKAIFTEVSFPNELQNIANLSDHHTSLSLKNELQKMPKDVPVIITHLKPAFQSKILSEIGALNEKRIQVLKSDGEIFNF